MNTFEVEWGSGGDVSKTITKYINARDHKEAAEEMRNWMAENNGGDRRTGYVISTKIVARDGVSVGDPNE